MVTSNEKTVADYVTENIKTAHIFKKHGIDFCCGGNISIEKACAKKNVDQEVLEKELNQVDALRDVIEDYNKWELDFLMIYIENVHHTYVKESIPLISEYISASGLSIEEWLNKLFDAVVIPYYHLLCKYGVSLIAHGQNVTLVMENAQPKRILLKDFQGDMRLIERDIPEQKTLDPLVRDVTVSLPEDLIIHDLQTGHFVTVLRFISPLVETLGLSEMKFYQLLGLRINAYVEAHPDYQDRFDRLDLFKPRILRIGLNLAKFRHSTDSSASRMLPDMDEQLDNPLYMALIK